MFFTLISVKLSKPVSFLFYYMEFATIDKSYNAVILG